MPRFTSVCFREPRGFRKQKGFVKSGEAFWFALNRLSSLHGGSSCKIELHSEIRVSAFPIPLRNVYYQRRFGHVRIDLPYIATCRSHQGRVRALFKGSIGRDTPLYNGKAGNNQIFYMHGYPYNHSKQCFGCIT